MRYNLLKSHVEIIDNLIKMNEITDKSFDLVTAVNDHLYKWDEYYNYSTREYHFIEDYCLIREIFK